MLAYHTAAPAEAGNTWDTCSCVVFRWACGYVASLHLQMGPMHEPCATLAHYTAAQADYKAQTLRM